MNAPFRERGSTRAPLEWLQANRRALVLVVILLIGSVLLWLAPPGFGLSGLWSEAGAVASAVSSAVEPAEPVASEPAPALEPVEAPAPVGSNVPAEPVPAEASSVPVQVVVREASWVEVTDSGGHTLLARTLVAGEAVGLDGALPMRVKIGNAAATEVQFRGVPVDFRPMTKDNVARFELK